MNATIETIHNRKSVRKFTDKPVPKEILEELVKAGMAAPSAVNIQPWAFIAIDDDKILKQLHDALPYAKMLNKAALVVCGDSTKTTHSNHQYWVQDCSAATENILLAAESLELGAVWTAVYPVEERMQSVNDILNIPEHITPLCVIPIGYPEGESNPIDKWKPENLRWQSW